MKVTQTADTITHAVIGGKEESEFQVNNSAEFFQILSDALYTNKPLATVRETLCNAWDAHIEAGKTDIPLEVTLSKNELKIQDFGLGIPDDMMGPLYGTYGGTSKQANANVTGGFGLGCKSPFSVCDHFEVTSCHNGVRSIWRISKSSGELNGKPSIKKIVSTPTTDTGVTVKIPITSDKDISDGRWRSHQAFDNDLANDLYSCIKGVTFYGGMLVDFTYCYDRREPKTTRLDVFSMPFHKGATALASVTDAAKDDEQIYVRYGNVIYPIPDDKTYTELKESLETILGLSSHSKLILQAEADTIAIAPSREALSMTDSTREKLREIMENFHAEYRKEGSAIFRKLIEHNRKYSSIYTLILNPKVLFNVRDMEKEWDAKTKRWTITTESGETFEGGAPTDIVFSSLARAYDYIDGDREPILKSLGHPDFSLMGKALQTAKTSREFNVNFLGRYRSILARTKSFDPLRRFLRKDVFYRIIKTAERHIGKSVRLYLMDTKVIRHSYGNWQTDVNFCDPMQENFLPSPMMLRPVIVLSHTQRLSDERYWYWPDKANYGNDKNVLLLTVPRNARDPNYIPDLELKLMRLGYVVVNLTVKQPWEPEKEKLTYVLQGRSRRGEGFLRLRDYPAPLADIPEAKRNHDPKYYIRLERDASSNIVNQIGLSSSEIIRYFPMLAKQTVVVFSNTEEKKVKKSGAKPLVGMVEKYILLRMSRDHDIRKFLKFIDYDDSLLSYEVTADLDNSDKFLASIRKHKFLRDKYLQMPELSTDSRLIANAIAAIRDKRRIEYSSAKQKVFPRGYYPKAQFDYTTAFKAKLLNYDSIPPSPKILRLAEKIGKSPLRSWLGYEFFAGFRTAKSKEAKDRIIKQINFVIQGK